MYWKPSQRAGAALAIACALLAGCSGSGTVTTLDEGPTVRISLPDFINEGGINADNVRPTVQLSNGANVSMQRGAGTNWSGTINVETGLSYTATVVWIERYEGRDLPLAQLTQEILVSNDGSIVRSDNDGYSTNIDSDSDGKTNLEERRNGSNPFDANDDAIPASANDGGSPGTPGVPDTFVDPVIPDPAPGPSPDSTLDPVTEAEPEPDPVQATADLVIPRVAAASVPAVDGAGVTLDDQGTLTGEWSAAVQVDNSGAPLMIDNLIVDIDAEAQDGAPYRRWAALHDGTYLYVLVMVDDDGDRNRDSGADLAQDDSLELFLDGNNSKLQRYDSDDYHRIIPVQLPGADKQSATAGDVSGPNSSQANLGLSFATGPGIGPDGIRRARWEQDVYELRIDLASAGINADFPFGFELQVNDDDGGGTRESKWAWKHPSGAGRNVDNTVSNPSFMGTVVLE